MRASASVVVAAVLAAALPTAAAAQAGSGRIHEVRGAHGLGPSASKVYRNGPGLSVGGHGGFLLQRFQDELESGAESPVANRWDAARAVFYVGYGISDRLLVNTGLSVEASEGAGLEFAYAEYRVHRAVRLRGGLVPVPMGLLNEVPEGPTFLGTTRPMVEERLIPVSWRENGLGLVGALGPVRYRGYVMNGFRGLGFDDTGLRGGRQNGGDALAEDLAGVVRADYAGVRGLLAGGSLYYGGSGQGARAGTEEIQATTLIGEAHARYRSRGVDLQVLVARAMIDEADRLNEAGADEVPEEMEGGYVQAGYDVLRLFGGSHRLLPYARYEWLDTQRDVVEGTRRRGSNASRALLLGVSWKPAPQIALKADYQVHANEAATGRDRLALALAYLF